MCRHTSRVPCHPRLSTFRVVTVVLLVSRSVLFLFLIPDTRHTVSRTSFVPSLSSLQFILVYFSLHGPQLIWRLFRISSSSPDFSSLQPHILLEPSWRSHLQQRWPSLLMMIGLTKGETEAVQMRRQCFGGCRRTLRTRGHQKVSWPSPAMSHPRSLPGQLR